MPLSAEVRHLRARKIRDALAAQLAVLVVPVRPAAADGRAQVVVIGAPTEHGAQSVPLAANRQVNSSPTAVSRALVQVPQNGLLTEEITPSSPPPSR